MKACLTLILIALLSTACTTPAAQPSAEPTQAPTGAAVPTDIPTAVPTDTPAPTDTPLPTNTPTLVPTDTPVPTATPDLTATAEFEATQAAEAAITQVQKDLEIFGIPFGEGSLAWFDPKGNPIYMDTYGQKEFVPVKDGLVVTNFIFKTDITWESKTGLAICGFTFRGDKDLKKGNYYLFNTIRLSGLPAWDIEYFKLGNFSNNVTGEIRFSELIDQGQGATNTYLLLARGGTFTVYANGKKLGSASSLQKADGELGFYGSQESGETTCNFTNVWVWELPDGSK